MKTCPRLKLTLIGLLLMGLAAATMAATPRRSAPRAEEPLAVRMAQEDFAQARQMVKPPGRWADWLASKRTWLRSWMAQTVDRQEWRAGVQHELVDAGTGAGIRWTPQLAAPAAADGKSFGAWVAWRRGFNLQRIVEAAYYWRVIGDTEMRDWAAAQIDFYADTYSQRPLRSQWGPARLMGQTLDESTSLVALCQAMRLLGPDVAAARLQRWQRDLVQPMAATIADARFGGMNIGVWNAVALAVAALQLDDKSALRQALDGPQGARTLLAQGVNADGLWYEGSLGYHQYVMAALGKLFEAAALTPNGPDLAAMKQTVQRMLMAPLALSFEDGLAPAIGDDRAGRSAIDPQIHFELRRHAPTTWGLAEARKRLDWDTLVDPVTEKDTAVPPTTSAASKNFDASRLALLRAGPWQLLVRYGQVSGEHWHVDALGYDLAFGKLRLSSDPGTVDYGSALHTGFFKRPAAHNVPVVDGMGPDRWQPGEVERFDAARGELVVRHAPYVGGVAARRSYQLKEQGYSETTELKSDAIRPQRLGQLLHLECTVDFNDATLPPPQALDRETGDGFQWWTQASQRAMPAQWNAALRCGDQVFKLSVAASAAHRLVQASEPTTPLPRRRTVLYLEMYAREANYTLSLTR